MIGDVARALGSKLFGAAAPEVGETLSAPTPRFVASKQGIIGTESGVLSHRIGAIEDPSSNRSRKYESPE